MKRILVSLFGHHFVFQLADWRMTWFPNKLQKKIKQNEAEAFRRRKLFYSSFIRKDDLCFDVGANIGNRIRPLLAIGSKVVAVEPQKNCYRFLQYKFGNKIKIVTKGLGEGGGIKDFHISDYSVISSFSDEWISAVKDGRFKGSTWSKTEKVEMTTLDHLIAEYGEPSFIKIDVEGYELEVLKGLTKPIKMVSFEYTVPEQTNKAIDCIRQIEKNNPNIECNYGIGESMELASHLWLSAEKMKEFIFSKEFCDTGFGDVYVRTKESGKQLDS